MNQKALLNGMEYTILDLLPSLDYSDRMVLCQNASGQKYICSKATWESHALQPRSSAAVTTHSPTSEKIKCFLSFFRGRDDLYARRFYSLKTGKSGYTPVCKNEWEYGLCDKKTYKCPNCPNRQFVPMTAATVKAHLIGKDLYCRDVMAIYPLLQDNTTWLLAADFDEENWQNDVSAFRQCAIEAGLTPAVERSRSGKGAHVWFFFSEPVPAVDARRMGSGLLTKTMSRRHELSFASYDRLFPSQGIMPKGGFGNLIALPFQGQAQKNGNTLFVNEEYIPYPDQWAFLSALPKITPEQLEECVNRLCDDGDMGRMAVSDETEIPWQSRPYRNLKNTDFPQQSTLMLADLIYLRKKGYSQAALNAIKRLAVFPNPEFRIRQKMRLPVYQTPRVLDCGYEDVDFIGIPRGCREALYDLLHEKGISVVEEDRRNCGKTIHVDFSGALRDEQKPAAEALLREDTGVLSATTAFGKTVIGAYLIGKRKTNTLILVQSSALLEQWKSALERFLDIHETLPEPPRKRGRRKKQYLIGQVGSGKNTRSGIIDIAIMQSLFEGEEKSVKEFVSEYGMVIVDECHHVAAFTFERVLRAVKAKYVYGLSATPMRKDGHHPIIFMQCGPVRYLVDAKSQAEQRSFSHAVIPRLTQVRLPHANSIQDIFAAITENTNRNALIAADAKDLLSEGRSLLILTERKTHAEQLVLLLEKSTQNLFLLVGSDTQKERRKKLSDLQAVPQNETLAVVATGKYIGEGFDLPRLDTLLLTMPVSWKGTLAQYAGRLHRDFEGKKEVKIYDYADIHVPALERMYRKRLKVYSDLGYQIRFGDQAGSISRIYDGKTYYQDFIQDITNAAHDILLVCPHIHHTQIQRLLPVLQQIKSSGVSIYVHTGIEAGEATDIADEKADALATLKKAGVSIACFDGLQQRYAIIDGRIVWYGNVDFLSFNRNDASVIRFDNADIAGELRDLSSENGGKQLTIDDYFE